MSLIPSLDALPHVDLLDGPTLIQRLTRIEEHLGLAARGIRLFAKRDDTMSLGGGGNKLRKLEYHLGHARRIGADTLISTGGLQSNHARLTAAAAAKHGFACELFLSRMVPKDGIDYEANGNVLLDDLFGAKPLLLARGENGMAVAEARTAALEREGRKALVIPLGGSTPTGALGYARCAREIAQQEATMDLRFDRVVVPNGSSGTQAGLVAGYVAMGRDPSVVRGYSVLADAAKARQSTVTLANETLGLLSLPPTVVGDDVHIDATQLGDGYGVATDAMKAAVRLAASREGLLLDPVYSGKAFAGLLGALRDGSVRDGETVLFVVTGGAPGLFAYREDMAS